MRQSIRLLGLVTAFGLMALLAGCSENLPCNTDPSQVDTARTELESAQAELANARDELSAAESRKGELEDQLDSLADADELRERLDVLKKGSGR